MKKLVNFRAEEWEVNHWKAVATGLNKSFTQWIRDKLMEEDKKDKEVISRDAPNGLQQLVQSGGIQRGSDLSRDDYDYSAEDQTSE